jgi:glycosyltransferase involved in cell wall biosynthesis
MTLPAASAPVTVVPEPLPATTAAPSRPSRPGEPLRFGLVGRLSPWKGQELFLRAFAEAFPGGREQAVIVGGALFGEEAYAAGIEALVTSLGLGDRVRLTGHVDDVEAELASLDVLVHASLIPEPFGMVVIEGMAAGLAVVAADAGGPAEVVADGVDGILYRMGDQAALGDALRHVAADVDLRQRLGLAARRSAEQYRPACLAPRVASVYAAVLGQDAWREA